MAQIPATINGVAVDFDTSVGNDVDQRVVDGLTHCVKPGIATGFTLQRIFISSAFDSHTAPSRHVQHKAVDISRINGTKIVIGYPGDAAIKAIVDAIQTAFDTYSKRRENFGPHFKHKHGKPFTVGGHKDHIHLSVN
jgi:hypothetical protein